MYKIFFFKKKGRLMCATIIHMKQLEHALYKFLIFFLNWFTKLSVLVKTRFYLRYIF